MADLPQHLKDKWDEAWDTGKPIDVGDTVVCDVCCEDYTSRPDEGGFIFGSYGYCPACAKTHEPEIRLYGEASYIKARCPQGQSFADFIRQYRGASGGTIQVTRAR